MMIISVWWNFQQHIIFFPFCLNFNTLDFYVYWGGLFLFSKTFFYFTVIFLVENVIRSIIKNYLNNKLNNDWNTYLIFFFVTKSPVILLKQIWVFHLDRQNY